MFLLITHQTDPPFDGFRIGEYNFENGSPLEEQRK